MKTFCPAGWSIMITALVSLAVSGCGPKQESPQTTAAMERARGPLEAVDMMIASEQWARAAELLDGATPDLPRSSPVWPDILSRRAYVLAMQQRYLASIVDLSDALVRREQAKTRYLLGIGWVMAAQQSDNDPFLFVAGIDQLEKARKAPDYGALSADTRNDLPKFLEELRKAMDERLAAFLQPLDTERGSRLFRKRVSPDAYKSLQRAVAALKIPDLDAADQAFAEAVNRQPNLAEAHVGLGMTRLWQGKFAEARQHADRALCLKLNLPAAEELLFLADLAARPAEQRKAALPTLEKLARDAGFLAFDAKEIVEEMGKLETQWDDMGFENRAVLSIGLCRPQRGDKMPALCATRAQQLEPSQRRRYLSALLSVNTNAGRLARAQLCGSERWNRLSMSSIVELVENADSTWDGQDTQSLAALGASLALRSPADLDLLVSAYRKHVEENFAFIGDQGQYSVVLTGIGSPVVPKLLALLRDKSFEHYWGSVASLLGNIGDMAAVSTLQAVVDGGTTNEEALTQAQSALRNIASANKMEGLVRTDPADGSKGKVVATLVGQLCRVDPPKDYLDYDPRFIASQLSKHGPDVANELADAILKTEDPEADSMNIAWLGIGYGPAIALETIADRYPTSDVPVKITWRLVDAVCAPGWSRREAKDRYTIKVIRELAEIVEPETPLANALRDAAPQLSAEAEKRWDMAGSARRLGGNYMRETAAMIKKRLGEAKPRTWPGPPIEERPVRTKADNGGSLDTPAK